MAAAPRLAADRSDAPGRADMRDVMIVDDSAVARAVMTRALVAGDRWRVVRAVSDLRAALAFLADHAVAAILLDVNLPGTDGLTGLPDLLRAAPGARIVVVSAAAAGAQAIAMGAAEVVAKPGPNEYGGDFEARLVAALDRPAGMAAPSMPPGPPPCRSRAIGGGFDAVAIGASTGGIHALAALLREVPAEATAPIFVTQHLPASFMPYFAEQLAVLARRPCHVAQDRVRVRAGAILVAPGDAHMVAVGLGDGGVAVRLSRAPAESGCLPSADPMFASLAAHYGDRLLVAVLSGMGRDGAQGAYLAHGRGGYVVAQDCATSVVWGMPGAAVAAGAVDAELAPDAIGRLVAAGRRPA